MSAEGWTTIGPFDQPARLLVMLSGGGRTMLNLADRIDRGDLPATIAGVVCSRDCMGVTRARDRGFPTEVRTGNLTADELGATARDAGADLIVLAGYLRLVRVPRGYENRVVNIHPALLPSFGGPGMYGDRVHQAVLASGCKVSGCTVHLCDAGYDTGPILVQKACEVRDDDTPEALAARVFELETQAYPEAIRALIEGRVSIAGRRARILSA